MTPDVFQQERDKLCTRRVLPGVRCGADLVLVGICVIAAFAGVAPSMAGVLTVTSLADSGAGSLRDQVAASAPGDIILFAVSGTISLKSSVSIPHTLYVEGPGALALTVDAGYVDRAFVTGGDPVFISGMVIQNGLVQGPPGIDGAFGQNGMPGGIALGGAILDDSNSVSLVLSNIWFNNNTAQGGDGGDGGGNPIGAAFVTGNGADAGGAFGGAVYSTGSVVVVRCSFTYNSAFGGKGGDGGTNFNAAVAEAGGAAGVGGPAGGGAVYDTSPGTVCFTNCTITLSYATGGAGGKGGDSISGPGGPGGNGNISQGGGVDTTTADFCLDTFKTNVAVGGLGGSGGFGTSLGPAGVKAPGVGGAIFGSVTACSSTIGSTLMVSNYASFAGSNYWIGFTDHGYNFIGSTDYVCSPFLSTTYAGSPSSPITAWTLPLAQNGGGLPTYALDPMGSAPLVDQAYSFGENTDNRGAPRPVLIGLQLPPGGDGSDIGSYEVGSAGLGLIVQTNNNLVVTWPAYYGNFNLQTATNAQPPIQWSYVPGTPSVVGNEFVVTNRMTNSTQIYRLVGK